MRLLGLGLVVFLSLLAVGLRQTADTRAERLLEGERRSLAVLLGLQRAALDDFRAGERPDLVALARAAGLDQLSGVDVPEGDPRMVLQDRDSLYALGWIRRRPAEGGPPEDGFVLRAWPRQHGVTGDLERHVDERNHLWEGQNTVGRSGLTRGYPPPFPEPDLEKTGGRWWRRPYQEALADAGLAGS